MVNYMKIKNSNKTCEKKPGHVPTIHTNLLNT